jgi:NTP pyrophosphatase (non-canonical NTP hydrolase)
VDRDTGRRCGSVVGTVDNVELTELQDVIERTYGDRDRGRDLSHSVAWLAEEFGELAQAIRKGTPDQVEHEFGDVLAWVVSLANQMDVDLTKAMQRYAQGCPKCDTIPCDC